MSDHNADAGKMVTPPGTFRDEHGKLYVARCPECGRDNYAMAVASGRCCWCGWGEAREDEVDEK